MLSCSSDSSSLRRKAIFKAFLFAGMAALTSLEAAEPKPNILLIIADDMGYGDVGFHQCKDIPTPRLDALAASGVRFTNGYVSGPICSPTRAGLITGRYQTRFGHESNGGAPGGGLPLTEGTLAARLKTAGYATGLIGKWHLGTRPEQHPQKRGFDEFFGFLEGGHSYFDSEGILRGTEQAKEITYTTDAFGREAAAFIEKYKNANPWFLYLAFNAPHTPMHATEDRLAKFPGITDERRRQYAAMMLALDEAAGLVLDALEKTGQAENTLIMFLSDNGGPTMEGVTVNASRNDPLRGSKRTTLEGGIRVPFVVAWPGHLKPGVYDQPAIQLDLHATALAAAGVAAQPEWKLEGVDLLPYLTGARTGPPHDALYWRLGKQMAIRAGDWKLVRYADSLGKNPNSQVMTAKLYNLAQDIHEDRDLAAAMPDKVQELQAKWDEWNLANAAPSGDGKGGDDGADRESRKARKKAKKAAAEAGD